MFHQFWVDKIQDKSLLEAIDSPYFRFLREKLAQKDNPLTPCPIIDHPEILQEAYKHFQPNASNEGAETIVTELCQGLNHYSCKVKKAFDPIWEQEKTDNYWHWRQKMGPKEGLHQEKTGKIIDFLRRKANF